ncbi:hypothetical protein [Shewanella algae]|uniref:hypothetical protein n=1 Tax=Shewanella algae TaxID=38313 RepID=UPI0031F575D6
MSRPEFNVEGSTVAVCEALASWLKPLIEGGPRDIHKVQIVERHIGRFDTPEEITRYLSGRDGGVRITALKVREIKEQFGVTSGTVDLVAYVFTTESFGYSRDTRAEVICGQIARALTVYESGAADIKGALDAPEQVQMDNLYSADIDKKGIAIWAVTWQQRWSLEEPLPDAMLDDFLRLHLEQHLVDGAPINTADINMRETP